MPFERKPRSVPFRLMVAAALVGCAQIVGADFDDLRLESSGAGGSGSGGTGAGGAGGQAIECVNLLGGLCGADRSQEMCSCFGCDPTICFQQAPEIISDCVCPSCAGVCPTYCSDAQGDESPADGKCDPYFEGCACVDCANHPLCLQQGGQ